MSGCTKCGGATKRTTYTSTQTQGFEYKDSCGSCGNVQTTSAQTKVTKWTSLPLFVDADIPGDMDVIAGSNDQGKAWRLPLSRIVAGGDLNKIQYSINKKTADIIVPRTQVVPVLVPGPNLPVEKAVADSEDNRARFLAISADPNLQDNLILQSTGFLVFPRTHAYVVGRTYYLHQENAGQVTSVKPTSGVVQPLFTVVDELTISINVGL